MQRWRWHPIASPFACASDCVLAIQVGWYHTVQARFHTGLMVGTLALHWTVMWPKVGIYVQVSSAILWSKLVDLYFSSVSFNWDMPVGINERFWGKELFASDGRCIGGCWGLLIIHQRFGQSAKIHPRRNANNRQLTCETDAIIWLWWINAIRFPFSWLIAFSSICSHLFYVPRQLETLHKNSSSIAVFVQKTALI